MKLIFSLEGIAMPVSQRFIKLISDKVNDIQSESALEGFTVNFKDSHYHPDHGGYHPVEVGVFKGSNGILRLQYITDFAYVGHPYPELVKEIDFEFQDDKLNGYLMGQRLNAGDSKNLYQLWEGNFLNYVEMDCFDEIKVNTVS